MSNNQHRGPRRVVRPALAFAALTAGCTPANLGPTELILIGLAIALFFGASKLPKLGKGLGEGIRNFKSAVKGEEAPDEKPARLPEKKDPPADKDEDK